MYTFIYLLIIVYVSFDINKFFFYFSHTGLRKSLSHQCVCVCVFHCQPTVLLRASGSAQGGQLTLSVVYFQFMHRLGRPHYAWDEYLYN